MAKKQASLDEITSRPYFNERKANKIAQTLTNASKQLQILDKDLSHNLEMTTGQVNEEEGRQLNDLVLEPVMKESRLRKRKFDQGSKKIQDVGDDPLKHTGNKTIVSEDTSKKAKKKRIKKKLSEDSFAGLDFFPVFPQDVPHGSRHCATNDPTSNGSVIPNHPMGTRNVPGGPPTPEQIRNDALLATITNACSHPAGDDHRLDARVASVTTAKKSPATLYHEKLIAVGQAALKVATYPARSDLPLSRSADVLPLLKAAAAQHAHHASAIIPSKPIALDQHVCKESPVPPPKRTFSARARFDPGTKPIIARKGNELDFPKAAGHTQADFSSSRTTTALKEAGSATVIGGLFTPSDPSTTNVPTGLTPKRPRTLSSPDEINFSPSASGASRSNPRREEEDWEVESGRLRARVDAEGTSDDGEAEESKSCIHDPPPFLTETEAPSPITVLIPSHRHSIFIRLPVLASAGDFDIRQQVPSAVDCCRY